MSTTDKNTAVFVIGAGRSGTSTITRALMALGVELGDHFKKASKKNPKGFFEDADLLAISKSARRVLGLRADSVRLLETDAFDDPKLKPLQDQAIEVIERRFSQHPIWGFKYGRTLRILPFWDRILEATHTRPAFVVALRHPLSVARSRAKIDPRRGLQAASDLEWLVSLVPYLRRVAHHRWVVVDYDDLMDTPTQELSRVAQELALPEATASEAHIEKFVADFLDPGLRHTRFNDQDLEASKDINDIVKDAYRLLKTRTSGITEASDAAFWAKWENIEARLEALRPILALIDHRQSEWRRAIMSPLGPLQSWALIKPWFKQ